MLQIKVDAWEDGVWGKDRNVRWVIYFGKEVSQDCTGHKVKGVGSRKYKQD